MTEYLIEKPKEHRPEIQDAILALESEIKRANEVVDTVCERVSSATSGTGLLYAANLSGTAYSAPLAREIASLTSALRDAVDKLWDTRERLQL